jgi:Rrf2 family transcriptional regulator, nitric oxide-sensitive transcriptional repressor
MHLLDAPGGMKLTSFTDYSLRVLIYLAAQPGRRATVTEIATCFEISENHLTKVVHFLGKHGWLNTVRGKGGGFTLAQTPEQIVVGEVVRRTEGIDTPAECFGPTEHRCRIEHLCQLRGVLQQAVDAFYRVLDGCTLADIARNSNALSRVLFLQVAP